jgi:hypothetical protein
MREVTRMRSVEFRLSEGVRRKVELSREGPQAPDGGKQSGRNRQQARVLEIQPSPTRGEASRPCGVVGIVEHIEVRARSDSGGVP